MRTALLFALACMPGLAHGKAQMDLGYRIDEVFSTAVRYVRVDRGCKITDQDPHVAFVIFECPIDEKRTSRGALEIFRAQQHGHDSVRIQVSLADEPHGAELRLVELLERKLREERGTPPPPPKPPVPAPPPVAPTDAGVKP